MSADEAMDPALAAYVSGVEDTLELLDALRAGLDEAAVDDPWVGVEVARIDARAAALRLGLAELRARSILGEP